MAHFESLDSPRKIDGDPSAYQPYTLLLRPPLQRPHNRPSFSTVPKFHQHYSFSFLSRNVLESAGFSTIRLDLLQATSQGTCVSTNQESRPKGLVLCHSFPGMPSHLAAVLLCLVTFVDSLVFSSLCNCFRSSTFVFVFSLLDNYQE